MVPNTSELLPEPETPVNTVSRRFGSSTLTSLRLLTRAPPPRIRSWRSADCLSVLVALLIVSPSVPGTAHAVARRPRHSIRVAARSASLPDPRRSPIRVAATRSNQSGSAVLKQPEHVAVGVGDGGHQAATADVVRRLLHG